jgi:hypothetical protein
MKWIPPGVSFSRTRGVVSSGRAHRGASRKRRFSCSAPSLASFAGSFPAFFRATGSHRPRYLADPKPLTSYSLTNSTYMLYYILNFTPPTRAAVPLLPHSQLDSHSSRVMFRPPAPNESGSLTCLESALAGCLPSNKQKARVTPLESALTNHFQLTEKSATLTRAESALTDMSPANALESALTKNRGGGGTDGPLLQFTALLHRSLRALYALLQKSFDQVSPIQSLAHSFLKMPGAYPFLPFRIEPKAGYEGSADPPILRSLLPYLLASSFPGHLL